MTYYRARLGDRMEMVLERLEQIGQDVGISFKFNGKTGSTRDSHRLVQLGKSKSPAIQTRVMEELYSAYFENEGDITSHAVLLKAGVKAGLKESEVDEWLKSDKGGKAVDLEVSGAQKGKVSGVPNFTIQEKYEVGGAQDAAVFVELFEKIKAAEASKA
jgi:predicted DsbA family dithiol-disulfide isomerase